MLNKLSLFLKSEGAISFELFFLRGLPPIVFTFCKVKSDFAIS